MNDAKSKPAAGPSDTPWSAEEQPPFADFLGMKVTLVSSERVTAEMLVTLPMGEGREQTVKVLSQRGVRGPYAVLRMISRACVARDHGIVLSRYINKRR